MKLVHAALRVQWIESPAANTTCSLLTVSGNCTLSDIAPSSLPLNCVDHGLEAGCQSDIELNFCEFCRRWRVSIFQHTQEPAGEEDIHERCGD
mmetsp:Transcript_59131/g.132499  ORF Transcript_59131/g.132499 Transcript_59131/m.132499 type:complete len:93 (+) Transcript_59131:60-338(+)